MSKFLVRHGDVLVAGVAAIPAEAEERQHLVLAEGEMTGHSHRIAEAGGAKLFRHGKVLFMKVTDPQVTLIHQEHGPITIPQGEYRVWQQREYSPEEIRTVRD